MKNIGIIGLGNIAHRVAGGIICSENANLYAVASRDQEKAAKFGKRYSAVKSYGSYDELLKDENVDIVYICTPNRMHYEHIMLCLSNHKHVICEKPLVENEKQVKLLFDEARKNNCFLMEAEKTMFTPLNVTLKSMVQNGVIGKLMTIKAEYSSEVLEQVPDTHWVLDKTMGGASYDIGVYPISFSHFFADAGLKNFRTQPILNPPYECDFGMEADILYENGVYAFLLSNWLYTPEHKGSAVLAGEKGFIEIPAFWKGTEAYLHKDSKVEKITVEMESDFSGEITHAVECVEKGLLESPVLSEEMSRRIIRIVEAVNAYRC
ncbi:MAG: Gfo/Idh/MocA family protein [Lachnospiraceae bacterium]